VLHIVVRQHREDFCGDAPKRCGTTGNGLYVSYAPLAGLNKLGADRAARIGAAVGPRDPSFLMGNPS